MKNKDIIKTLSATASEEEIRAHYKHMCQAGFDPILCINKLSRFINFKNGDINERSFTDFGDFIITENKYVTLLTSANIKVTELDDIIFIPFENVCVKHPAVIAGRAAIFWLYPSGCKTLRNMYNKHIRKIQYELYIDPKKIIIK